MPTPFWRIRTWSASWPRITGRLAAGPSDRLFSVFSVVRNPSDYWPLYGCIVIGVGLLLVFVPKLYRFVRSQGQSRARLQPQG